MIALNDFIPLVVAVIPRLRQFPPNLRQEACVLSPAGAPLMIVAGPGSGKTTVLVLRALRLVLVDRLLPENIVITTFTRKAAEEIRARLIEWGLSLLDRLRANPPPTATPNFGTWLDSIDVNRFFTGTLDSICEEVLTRYRDPVAPVPAVIEGFVANAGLAIDGLFPQGINRSAYVDRYLAPFSFDGNTPANFGEKLRVCRTLVDRFVHDHVDLASYRNDPSHAAARNAVATAAQAYWGALATNNRLDFATLEQAFLDRLVQGRLAGFVQNVRAVLVDEYQDTNPLQESIYFELVRQTRGSFAIVGDDDQSLYRFRGATIELFRDFLTRFQADLPGFPVPQMGYLVDNYRSTPEIVGFFNDFIETDPAFAAARVQPPKPRIVHQLGSHGVPVLGMFRPDVAQLADHLTDFLFDVFRGNGRPIHWNGPVVTLRRDPVGGDFGDAVLLAHTVNEYARPVYGNPPRVRLPRLLRDRLATRGISVFNPRGRALRDIPVVQELLGTILECIDPLGTQQGTLITQNALRGEAIRYLNGWRDAARNYAATNPVPTTPHTLGQFIHAWQMRAPQGQMTWPAEWPILELCFKLLSWVPELRDDPEGQVYLEAVSRAIAQAATFSSYRSNIVFGHPTHGPRSVQRAIMDIFAPMAENDLEVDEEIMPSVPRDRFCFMTIHQAKGLEFPLVIVDVSSDYRINNHRQRFRRFPEDPSNVAEMEDDLAAHCAIGPLRMVRNAMERTFDDLVRLYYVAYSRAQSVLMLVGLDPCLRYQATVRHVAMGWRRDGTWSWRTPVGGRAPALADNIPFELI